MQKKECRRQFCQEGGLAAFGLLFATVLPGVCKPRIAESHTVETKVTGVVGRVISVKGTCAVHGVGDEFKITENGVQGKVCIHALYSMLPAAFAMLYGADFPWLRNPDVKTHACPDAANPVVFELTRIRE